MTVRGSRAESSLYSEMSASDGGKEKSGEDMEFYRAVYKFLWEGVAEGGEEEKNQEKHVHR